MELMTGTVGVGWIIWRGSGEVDSTDSESQ